MASSAFFKRALTPAGHEKTRRGSGPGGLVSEMAIARFIAQNQRFCQKKDCPVIELGELIFTLSTYQSTPLTLFFEFFVPSNRNEAFWNTRLSADSIPMTKVPILFRHLAEIVDKINKEVPQANIPDHFKFICGQAKT